jgi:DNA-binding NarL/FixJ family response regulator
MESTVFIADDHPIVLNGLMGLISSEPGFKVIGTETDGMRALDAIVRLRPDVSILDMHMPSMTGLGVLAKCNELGGEHKIILLAASLTNADVFDAAQGGVAGVLLKEAAPSALMSCLREVVAGGRWLPPELVGAAILRETDKRDRWRRLSSRLTPRETEVVSMIAAGSTNKEIAFALHISDGTTKVHLNNIFRKLNVTSRTELLSLVSKFAGNQI